MLNELLEFQEYTCKINKGMPRRLIWGNVVERKFSGIPRALTVIVRYAYCNKGITDIEKIKELLGLWCGFKEESKYDFVKEEEFANIIGWLPKYIESLANEKIEEKNKNIEKAKKNKFENMKSEDIVKLDENIAKNEKDIKSIKTKMEKALTNLESNKDKWSRSPFKVAGGINDINAIYFEGIIADAINEGPLKKMYLRLKKDPMENVVDLGKTVTTKEKNMYDKWLKTIAAVVMGQIDGSEYSDVDYGNLANWIKHGAAAGDKIKKNVISNIIYTIGGKEINIIDAIHPLKEQEKYLCLNREWKKIYDPRIISEDDLKNVKIGENDIIFEDNGCNELLTLKK